MTSIFSPAAEYRLARLARIALREIVHAQNGNDVHRQSVALAIARMIALSLPLLSRDARGQMTITVQTEGTHLNGKNIGDWTMNLQTMPDFHRRVARQTTWRDAQQADVYRSIFQNHATREGRDEIDVVSQHLSLALVRAAVEAGRNSGEIVVRDAQGPLLILRIQRTGLGARVCSILGRAWRALGLGDREIAHSRYEQKHP